jgi:hypothetical protein
MSTITLNLDGMIRRVDHLPNLLVDEVEAVLRRHLDVVDEAKRDAPWTDQTGDARRELNGDVIRAAAGEVVTLYLQHGVYYGIYLETKHGGKWGIVMKVLEARYDRIMADLQRILR